MKKIFMILAVAAIAVALPSCGGETKKDDKNEQKADMSAIEAKATEYAKKQNKAMNEADMSNVEKVREEVAAYKNTLSKEEQQVFSDKFDAELQKLMSNNQ